MALIEQIQAICDRLAPHGWSDLLAQHGLNIGAPDLATELARELPAVRRDLPGFEDFAQEGHRGIEPGHPARSLLFHALASPHVRLDADGLPLGAFPTLAEIDVVENYVYGARTPSLQELRARANGKRLGIVVFAGEYRPASHTCHKRHADMVFARTGIARVGTADPLYEPQQRGFLPYVESDPLALRVLPARYAAYIAVQQPGDAAAFCPMRHLKPNVADRERGDETRSFWLPLHKLFGGAECIRDFRDGLDIRLEAQHWNEKIRRIHLQLGREFDTGWGEPDISKPPFRFQDGIAAWSDQAEHGPGVLAPIAHTRLVEPAQYQGQPLRFNVPSGNETLSSSLRIPWNGDAISAPEYVHVRHRIAADGSTINLNTDLNLDQNALEATVAQGDYQAQHYVDFTGDGWITAVCPQLTVPQRGLGQPIAAYSLVTAPDFFPTCDQRELTEWVEGPSVPISLRDDIWQTPPDTLSDARLPANLQLPNTPFKPDDDTLTAIVSLFGEISARQTNAPAKDVLRHSHLPDDAAGVFAPGWDVSHDRNRNNVMHLAAYGLGSPFPEDGKLCAALSTFWPAVAPDATRTMNPRIRSITVSPLTDEEIGRVGELPWDGIRGPDVVQEGNAVFAEYTSFAHADYVESALDNKFTLALTGRVDSDQYKDRVLAMAFVYRVLGGEKRNWLLLSFGRVSAGDPELQQAQRGAGAMLFGDVYRFVMFPRAAESTAPGKPTKRRIPIRSTHILFASPRQRRVIFQRGQNAWGVRDITR